TPTDRANDEGCLRPASAIADCGLRIAERPRTIETDWVATPSRDSRATGQSGGSDAWCRRGIGRPGRARSRSERCARFLHPPIDLLDRLRDLRASPLVGRGHQLTIELGARQPQRFERLHFFRVAHRFPEALRTALALQLYHAFPPARFRVNA